MDLPFILVLLVHHTNCDGITNPPSNTAPVASLIATPASGVTPLEVVLDASGSSDADNDTLTYTIDYGDGTSGTGITSSHIYTTGNYTATVTVNDGNGGIDTASVNITVNDDVIIDPPNTDCSFGTPLPTPLETINTSFTDVHVLGSGGSDIGSINKFTINWDLENNGLYQFSFDLNVAPWYVSFTDAVQSFNQPNPSILLTNTGIAGLDGTYSVAINEGNFVLVANDYSLYFSNSDIAPDCNAGNLATNNKEDTSSKKELDFALYPNPAVHNIFLEQKTDLRNHEIIISDFNGKAMKSFTVNENTKRLNVDVTELEAGLYLVKVIRPSGTNYTMKFLVQK